MMPTAAYARKQQANHSFVALEDEERERETKRRLLLVGQQRRPFGRI